MAFLEIFDERKFDFAVLLVRIQAFAIADTGVITYLKVLLINWKIQIHQCLLYQYYWLIYIVRTYSSCFMHPMVVRMRLPLIKIFSNFVHFGPNFQVFYPFSLFLCPFSEKLHACPYFLLEALVAYYVILIEIHNTNTNL